MLPNHGLVGRRRRATTSASTAPFIDAPHSRVPLGARRLPSLESLPIDTHQAPCPDLADQRRRSFSPLFRKASQHDYTPPPYPNAREDLSSDSTSWFTPRSRRSSKVQSPPPPPMDILPRTKPVIETHTINKEYDPLTGKKMINDYLIIKELGRGVHGKVKLAEDTERGGLVAIKVVDKESRRRQLGLSLRVDEEEKAMVNNPAEQKIQREIAILKKCVHPHVVMLFEVIDDPASRKIYMVLEYMEGGEIHWRDEDDRPILPIDDARAVFRDVVSGLDYLHYQGIVHRDIKPANLLLTADHVVKISDFGVSYFSELLAEDHHSSYDATSRSRIARELAKTAGSPAFFAPELCTVGDDMGLRITKAIDVWALGVTLYCLVFGRCPFEAETEYELFKLIPTQPLEFPADIEIEDDLRDLLCKLLTKDFEHRITLDQVRLHPWVTADLEDPELWKEEADPRHYKAVEVTDEEVSRAVTITEKIRRGIQRLSSSISHFTQAFDMKRKGKSLSSQGNTPQSHSPLTKTASSSPGLPTPEIIHFSPNRNKELPSLGGDTTTPSNLTKLRNAQAQADASNVMPDFDDDRFEEADQESVLSNHHSYSHDSYDYSDFDSSPWPLERKDSSASTLSGLVIGRGRQRSTDADAT
ncbi:hypothetical protein INT44_005470 [Umbelopsis vinacea]|uniref:non-specific serine/threonine protein kinase n=1 Tax=Umbelopsis vinacea TaxID=44442 RepID=A0A8H7Q918_9FUNG|nr:hypothetical protein INT44_005470 [Umbelopsis vinacea]